MDYLSRILLTLPRRDKDEMFLPRLREFSDSVASRANMTSEQGSPTEERESALAAAEILRRFTVLEQAAGAKTNALSSTAGETRTGVAAARERNSARVSGAELEYQRFSAPLEALSSEELSRIFQRDARRYG